MNELTKHLVDGILNEDKQEVVALYAGGFKPPTAGHFLVVEEALKQYPEIDKLIVLVGGGVRDGIEQAESILVWEIYQNYLPMKVEIQPATKPPIGAVYSYAKNNLDDIIYWVLGARDGKDEDFSDIVQRTAAIDKAEDKYNNVEVKVITTSNKDMSGTNARKALLAGNREAFHQFLPSQVEEKDEIFSILRPAVKETDNPDDGKAAPYGSGYGKVNENASYSKDIDIQGKIDQLTQHMIDKGYNIEPLPALEFVDGDTENARDFFGKTAYYDPINKVIVLYTEGRHPKDIARSYAHEMIHHIQNLEGRLGNITTTNTQEDDYLNDIEAEANLKGTMTFRNWTDSLNEIGDASAAKLEWNPAQIKKIAKEIERKISNQEEDTVEYYDMLPVINVISPESRTRYRVTVDASIDKPEDELAMTTLRVDFTTEEGGDDAINKGEQYKILATLTDIIIQLVTRVNDIDSTTLDLVKFYAKDDTEGKYANPDSKRGKLYQAFINKNLSKLPGDWKMSTSDEVIMLSPVINEAIVGDKIECDNCDWSWKIVDGGDDLFICHKCGHDNTPIDEGFNKKLGKDPFGLEQFARELMTEGAYDSLVTQLTKATINKWVEDSKKKPIPKKSFVDIDIDDVDGKGREIEFNYVGMVEFDKKVDGYEVDGTSNSGEEEDKFPFIATLFKVNPKVLPQAWSKISADVSDVIRHEIEHLTQTGDNLRTGKYMDDDIQLRDLINKAKILPQSDYYKLEKEVDAMLQGLYLKAKKTRKPFKDVIKNYLDIAPGLEAKEDKEIILNLWRSRRGALSLPVFENEEKVMDYKIYLDMDGVLVDFDQQFKDLTGMMPREFEAKYGSTGFWEAIDKAGVGFWRGMSWMPGGEALYNRASQFDHELLSSPSRSELSKIGKRLWRRDKTPNTKLTLSRSYLKKNYAAPNHILIDDREDNIQQWRDAGGIGILYTSANQVNAELDKLGL
ncbi:hypothetical protein OAU24_00860 [bacterium]|nr:hypothetical protein [bacterium]